MSSRANTQNTYMCVYVYIYIISQNRRVCIHLILHYKPKYMCVYAYMYIVSVPVYPDGISFISPSSGLPLNVAVSPKNILMNANTVIALIKLFCVVIIHLSIHMHLN